MAMLGTRKAVSGRKTLPNFGSKRPQKPKPKPQGFDSRFKAMKPEQRHKLVQSTLERRFGKDWRKKVYGKNYESGTLKKQNRNIQSLRARKRQAVGNLNKLEAARINPSRSSDKAAIEKKLSKLHKKAANLERNYLTKQDQRKKYLNIRDKALKNAVKSDRVRSTGAKEKKLTATVEEHLRGKKKKKKAIRSSGGTTAK